MYYWMEQKIGRVCEKNMHYTEKLENAETVF